MLWKSCVGSLQMNIRVCARNERELRQLSCDGPQRTLKTGDTVFDTELPCTERIVLHFLELSAVGTYTLSEWSHNHSDRMHHVLIKTGTGVREKELCRDG